MHSEAMMIALRKPFVGWLLRGLMFVWAFEPTVSAANDATGRAHSASPAKVTSGAARVTVAYVGTTSDEIEPSSIETISKPKISDFVGSYHFGESEGESEQEILFSNGKLFARTVSQDWRRETWVPKIERDSIQYLDGRVKIGQGTFGLAKCIKATPYTLNKGELGLVSDFYEENNGVRQHYIQFNTRRALKIEAPGAYPETIFVKLAPADLAGYSSRDLRIMRNEIYARHGYLFKSGGEMSRYFSRQRWYRRLTKSEKIGLSQIERHNVKLLGRLEK